MAAVISSFLEWGAAGLPLPGQRQSGDLHLVSLFPGGALLAAMDGLGHGEEAARAASIASAVLQARPREPVVTLVRRCHAELRATRGAVMSLASLDGIQGRLSWVGVGNVQGVLARSGASGGRLSEVELLLRAGVVGAQLPTLLPTTVALARGDTLVFATDGIESGFDRTLALAGAPQRAAESILARYGRRTDDALVLVARYLGGGR